MLTKTKDGNASVYRNNWFEFTTGWRGIDCRLALGGYFDPRVQLTLSLGWGILFLYLPIRTRYDECDPPRYGFYYHSAALWFCWRRKTKALHLPWYMDFYRHSKLLADGLTWETEYSGKSKNFWDVDKWPVDLFWRRAYYPYRYQLQSGETQHVTAHVMISVREWRPSWFKWTRLFAHVRRTIEVEFDAEVGERAGSWKGGVTGCNYEMRDGESWQDTLRRMQDERKFD